MNCESAHKLNGRQSDVESKLNLNSDFNFKTDDGIRYIRDIRDTRGRLHVLIAYIRVLNILIYYDNILHEYE